MYKLYSFPVPINSSSQHAIQLVDIPDYFLLTEDNQHYATISASQIYHCRGINLLFCPFNIALQASAAPSCLSSIFFNQKEDIRNLCDFRLLLNSLSSSIYELSPSHILVYRINMIALDCSSGQKILKGCAFCVMRIPCRCAVSSDNL